MPCDLVMDRTASLQLLASTASETHRKVFASLSFGQRLAMVILKLASTFGQQFGQTVYAAALYYGAEGMPDVKGAPAKDFGPKDGESFAAFVNRFLRKPVQRDYGYDFGMKFYNYCRKKVGDEKAGDLVMDMMEQVLKPGSTIHKYLQSLPLKKIESSFFQAADNKFKDMMRSQKRRKTDGMPTDEEGAEVELADRDTSPDHLPSKIVLKKLDEKLEDPDVRKKVEQAAKSLGPELDTYFQLLMDGFEPREIYNLRLLPGMQSNLPPDLRLDPSRPDPFDTSNYKHRDEKGMSNKDKEKQYKEEIEKYPNPLYKNPTSFLNHHKALMEALQEAIEDAN